MLINYITYCALEYMFYKSYFGNFCVQTLLVIDGLSQHSRFTYNRKVVYKVFLQLLCYFPFVDLCVYICCS